MQQALALSCSLTAKADWYAVAMLTAFPLPGSEWQEQGADEMLVKPMNTQDLLVQIEALLVTQCNSSNTRLRIRNGK